MSRIVRSLLLLVLVLSMLPSASARAQNPPVWQGTIVYVFHVITRLEFTYVSHPNYYPTTSHSVETMRVQIDVGADGSGVQTVTYENTLALERVSYWGQGGHCYGHYRGTGRATSTVSLPAPAVWVDDEKVITSYNYSPTPVVWEGEGDSCYYLCCGAPIENSVFPYIQPWYHNGAFTPEDTSIAGRDRWANWFENPGGNYVDKRTPVSNIAGEGVTTETSVRFTSYMLSREEQDTPWLPQSVKDYLTLHSEYGDDISQWLGAAAGICAAVTPCVPFAAPVGGAAGLEYVNHKVAVELVEDPPDPNYTEIALPVTPTMSLQPVLPGGGITAPLAHAFNAYFENAGQGIGLARAILISFDRASGAQAANNSYWVNRQLQAARLYSGQFADVLDARPQLLADLQEALSMIDGLPFGISARDLSNYTGNLVINGFSAEQQQLLAELGMDTRGQEEILNALLEVEFPAGALPEDTIATFPDFLTDEGLMTSTRNVAAALREFSLSGADPALYLPLVAR